jgi:CheY-specific phosphatase CheX
MRRAPTSFDIQSLIDLALRDVFERMLSMSVQSAAASPRPEHVERVVGSVGLAGESVTGAVFLHVSEVLARQITAAMLAVHIHEIQGGEQVNDVVSEVTNMLGGRLKSRLCDAGFRCAMSTPTIIRGSAFRIETAPELRPREFFFLCGQEKFLAAVHLKFKDSKDYDPQSAQCG